MTVAEVRLPEHGISWFTLCGSLQGDSGQRERIKQWRARKGFMSFLETKYNSVQINVSSRDKRVFGKLSPSYTINGQRQGLRGEKMGVALVGAGPSETLGVCRWEDVEPDGWR